MTTPLRTPRRGAAGAPRRRRQAGIALLLTVWLLALLTVIAGEFMFSARVRSAAERNKRDDLRGWSLAIAGYRAALAALDDQISGVSLAADGTLLIHYRGDKQGTPAAADRVPLGGGTYSWRIDDENGRLRINELPRPLLVKLLGQCGMQPGAERDTVADSILDWRDPNREHRLNGAEEDWYRALEPPYSCKDGRVDVLEELLLVRGVTPQLFIGGTVDGKSVPGLRDLLTAVSIPEEVGLATAPKPVLEVLGRPRPTRPAPASRHYTIVATGRPGGGAPARALRAVVQREDAGDSRSFTLLYWNDQYSPE